MYHRNVIDTPIDDLFEPEGLTEWRVADQIDAYVRQLRRERAASTVKPERSVRDQLRSGLNAILYHHGFRVSNIPGWQGREAQLS